jgi:predicted MFS family arabinose efflux permease
VNSPSQDERRYAWYVVCLLLVVYMVHHLDRMVITLVLEPIGHEFKLSDSQLGLLAGVAYAVPFAIAGLPLGMLIDRVRRVRLLALLLTIWSGLTALCALAGSYWVLVVTRAGVAAAESGGTPANMSIISDYVPAQRRGSAFGVYYMGPHLGTIIGFAVAGAVAATYGWRAAFLVVGLPGLLLAGLVVRTIREPRRGGDIAVGKQTATVSAPPSLAVALKTLWSRRAALHLIVACTIANMVAAGLSTWLPALLIRNHGADLRTVGMTIAFGIAPLAALGSLLSGRLVDAIKVRNRARVATFLAVCTAITIPAAASGIMSASIAGVVIAFAVQGIAHVCLVGPSYAAVMERVPAETRGITAAVMQVSSNVLGFGVGAQVVGVGSDLLHASAGDQSLRLAMLGFCFVNLLAIAHYLRAAALMRRETVQPSGDAVLAR